MAKKKKKKKIENLEVLEPISELEKTQTSLKQISNKINEFNDILKEDSLEEIENNIREENRDLKNASILKNYIDENYVSNIEESFTEPKKTNKFLAFLKFLLLFVCLGAVVAYCAYKFLDAKNFADKWYIRGNYFIIAGVATSLFLTVLINKKGFKNFFGFCTVLLLMSFIGFNIANEKGYITLPGQPVVEDFTGIKINEALSWAQKNNIEVNQTLEYSDNFEENIIITQDVKSGVLVKDVKKINFVVSNGPSYDKELVVPDMVGWKADDVFDFIKKNFLNNITINYEINNDVAKDLVISQSYKGQMKRDGKVEFKISLGRKEELKPVPMEDLKNKSEFDATLWIKRNGVSYNINYEFSNTFKKGTVLNQSIEVGKNVDPNNDKVTLTISKGKKIITPNLLEMTSDQVTAWVIENNLKIYFDEAYDSYASIGTIIKANLKKDDEITEGTTVKITTSKGQLKFPSFDSLASFRSWASNNNIKFTENYEYSDTISKGNIIKFSINKGDNVILENNIVVTVSSGKAIQIPNFVGMSKSNITSKCNSIGIYCSFYYTGYSSTARDVATKQSVNAGNTVISGTSINIGLSSGPAQTFNVYIQSEWFSAGNPDGTISTIKNKLAEQAPGVTFNFVKKGSNTGAPAGFIHESSPVKGGNNSFTQGKTYTIWIIN